MPWLQLHLEIPASTSAAIEAALESAGAQAITLRDASDQPLFEPPPGSTPLWEHVIITALLPAEQQVDPILSLICEQAGLSTPPPYRQEILEDRIWEREWLKDFRPMRFGKRLWVCPHGTSVEEPDAIVLHLDPGLAFGTGTHPTTAMCLEWLESLDLNGRTVVDFGCGSGILALAALLLGAKQVWAVDNDPQAITATRANLAAAGLAPDRLIAGLPAEVTPAPVDIVVANILAGTLIALAPDLQRWFGPNTGIALSGILSAQAPDVLQVYQPLVQQPLLVRRSEDWTCLHSPPAGANQPARD